MESERCIEVLPEEVLVKIFSYLKNKDRVTCRLVCSRWKNAFSHPHLWKKVFYTGSNISGFSAFIQQFSSIEKLCITWQRNSHYTSAKYLEDENVLKYTVASMKKLTCLRVYCSPWLNSRIFYNPLVRHGMKSMLQVSRTITHLCLNILLKDEDILNLANKCQKIEYLNISASYGYSTSTLVTLINSQKSSLRGIFLGKIAQYEECIEALGQCTSLIELGLYNHRTVNLDLFILLTKLPHLKLFFLKECIVLSTLLNIVLDSRIFPSLEHLKLVNCGTLDESSVSKIVVGMPKLETLTILNYILIPVTLKKQNLIIKLLKEKKSIKNVSFAIVCQCLDKFLIDLAELHKERKFNSVCFCGLLEVYSRQDYEKIVSENFVCRKCNSDRLEEYICECYHYQCNF